MFEPGSITGGTITLAVACVGVGTVAFPLAFAEAGIVLSAIFLLVIGIFTIFSIRHMAFGVEVLKLGSYEDMSRLLLGTKYETAVRVMLISHNFGVAVGYIVVIAEMLVVVQPLVQSALLFMSGESEHFVSTRSASAALCHGHSSSSSSSPHLNWLQQTFFDTACSSSLNAIILSFLWLVLLFPLSLAKTMDSLRFASSMAILSTCFIMACVVYRYFVPFVNPDDVPAHIIPSPHGKNADEYGLADSAAAVATVAPVVVEAFRFKFMTLLALPIMMYSLDCQCFVFQIYNDLSVHTGNRTMHGITTVGFWATIIACMFFFGVGAFGAMSFGDKTKGNILQNYDPLHDPLFGLGFILYSFPVVMAFVFTLFPCRDALFNVVYGLNSSSFEITATAPSSPTKKKKTPPTSTDDLTKKALLGSGLSVVKREEASKEDDFPTTADQKHSTTPTHLPPNVTPDMVPVYPSYHHESGSMTPPSSLSGVGSILPKFPEIALPHSVVIGHHHRNPSPFNSDDNEGTDESEVEYEDDGAFYMTPTTFYLWSGAMSFCALIVAIFTPGIVVIIGLLGAMCSSTLCFTYPALYRLAMDANDLVPFYRSSATGGGILNENGEEFCAVKTNLLPTTTSASSSPSSPPGNNNNYGSMDGANNTAAPSPKTSSSSTSVDVVPAREGEEGKTVALVGPEAELAALLADPECRIPSGWWEEERAKYGEVYFYFYIRFERVLTHIMLWLGIIGCVLGTTVASYKVAMGDSV